MYVAFVHAGPTVDSALARRTRRTAALLAATGHEATVLCVRWWDGDRRTFERDGVTYRAVADGRRWFAPKLPAALAGIDPDAIHAAGSDPGAVLAAWLADLPLVVDWCGEETPRWLDRAFDAAAAVVVPSEHVRTKVRERGADAEVFPGSIDVGAIRAAAPTGASDVVWSGRLDGTANLESLLLALAELRDRELTVTVIGDGPARGDYERGARDLRIDDRVEFVGALPRGKRIARFKGAHAFVHTADGCPFAAELLRALACGCVGIVEYQLDSAAHEPVAGYDRGFGVTSDEGIVDAIEAAGELPHVEYDDRFERFGRRAVLESYLDRYRTLGATID